MKKISILILICLFDLNFNFLSSYCVDSELLKKNNDEIIINEKKEKKDQQNLFDYQLNGNKFKFSLRNRTEGFYGRSTQLFSESDLDQVLYWQSTWDLKLSTAIGRSLKADLVLRNKARWGNINSINHVTENDFKIKDAVTGKHRHSLGRLLFWMREGWLEILLNDAFNIKSCNEHYFKLGAFPFKLGRGISLGDAYAVSPGLLGFYSNNVIDQYAFGWVFHGDIFKDQLTYDLYGAILENQSDSFDNVNDKIYSQEIGRRNNPERGFGHINFIVASKLDWIIKACNYGIFTIEPYIMYNRNPEQKIDFPADSSSNLMTLGLYIDQESENFEFGIEFAKNFGSQKVKGWDRNKVIIDRNDEGDTVFAYSHVFTEDPTTVKKPTKALQSNKNKKIVDNSIQSPCLNGKEIEDTGLFNGINRFRAPYTNKYTGFMFVGDAAYWVTDNLRLATTVGWATGDEDPNQDLNDPNDSDVDGNYEGFIGLQEIYSGKRVQSVFVLGPNRIPRPLSFPSSEVPEEDLFASNLSGFSNLVFVGFGADWTSCGIFCNKEFNIKPNILAYWQDTATKKFSIKQKKTINQLASKYLGFELNLFMDVKLLKSLKGFFIIGVFIPGQHYKDIEGKPLNKDQREILDKLDSTGFRDNNLPLLGTNPAWSLNWGFEYQF